MSTPYVRAVLVTDTLSPHLQQTLDAIAALDVAPQSLEVVLVGAQHIDLPPGVLAEVSTSAHDNYADAVNAAVAGAPARDGEVLWLLHDDTAPAPDALKRLVATLTKRKRAAVVGASHSRWNDASRLVNVGTTVTRLGLSRVGLVVEDDIDQGQHDWRDDVLAVSLAAALIRREAWEAIGGIDAGYKGFGASLDWCRRSWASGWDVVVEPSAKVRHAQDGLYGVRGPRQGRWSTQAMRKAGQWHHAIAWAPLGLVPVLAVAVPISAALRTILRLTQNSGRLAAQEAAVPVVLMGRVKAIAATRRARVLAGHSVPSRLFASPKQSLDALRQREWGGKELARAARAPSDIVRAELAQAGLRHRRSGAIAFALGAVAALTLGWEQLTAVVGGKMLGGPALGATDVSASVLWTRAWTGWSDAGLGNGAIDGNFAALMAPFALLPGGLRVGVAVILVAAPLVSTMAAWWAAGIATRSASMRVVAAVIYTCWPPFVQSVLDGRLGAIVVHLALPLAAGLIARSLGWAKAEVLGEGQELSPKPSVAAAAPAASLVLGIVTVAQPVLVLPLVGVLAGLGFIAGRARWRLVVVAIVPVTLALPTLLAALRAGNLHGALSVLARDPGPVVQWQGSVTRILSGASLAESWPDGAAAARALVVILPLLLATAAVAATWSRQALKAASAGVTVAAVGLVVAAWSARAIAAWPDAEGRDATRGWPGAGASVLALGLLLACLVAHGCVMAAPGRRAAAARIVSSCVALVAVFASIASIALVAWPGAAPAGVVASDPHVLPLAVPLELEADGRERAVVLGADDNGAVTYNVLSHDGTSLVAGRSDLGPDGEPLAGGAAQGEPLRQAIGALALSPAAPVDGLKEWGIELLVVPSDASVLRNVLDQNPSLALVSGSERGVTYRLVGEPASRAWVVTGATRVAARSWVTGGSVSLDHKGPGVLVIAATADSRWKAWADGISLKPTNDDLGRAAFDVPEGARTVTFAWRDPFIGWWRWLVAAVLLWAALGSVPLRRSTEVQP